MIRKHIRVGKVRAAWVNTNHAMLQLEVLIAYLMDTKGHPRILRVVTSIIEELKEAQEILHQELNRE